MNTALRFGSDGAFDLVERLAASPSTKLGAVDALRRILDYCEQHPSRMWYQNTWNMSADRTPNKSGQRSERLLRICIELAKAESLLARELAKRPLVASKRPVISTRAGCNNVAVPNKSCSR